MLAIEPVQLGVSLPTDSISFVFMHPFLNISGSEPHKWLEQEKDLQITRIQRCLDISTCSGDPTQKTLFTVFPEYGIPGLEGVAKIQTCLEDDNWRTGTIVIGGIDGLTKEEYANLCQSPLTSVSDRNRPEIVNNGQSLNCMMVWAVTEDQAGKRITRRWVQPKLCPSGLEEQSHSQHMFEGQAVNIYECKLEDGRTFRFFCLLCYDWVAPLNSGIVEILSKLNDSWSGADPKVIHLVFVLQHNNKPNHASFLSTVVTYFNEQVNTFVSRTDSILAFVNTAGSPSPGYVDSYGFSSLVYSPNLNSSMKACPPSYAIQTQRLRHSDSLQTCRDILFRENGACIHSFQAFQPRFLIPFPAQTRRLPLGQVSVHGIDTDAQDPRTPGGPVAAIVKWVNDKLDLVKCLDSASQPIKDLLLQKQEAVIQQLRSCDYGKLNKIMAFADNFEREPGCEDDEAWLQTIDQWLEQEEDNLLTLVHALSLVTCTGNVEIDGVTQAYMLRDSDIIDLIVISGPTHRENLERVDAIYPGYQGRKALIISRDRNDSPMTNLDKQIFDVSDTMRCGFHDLKHCLATSSVQDFTEKLTELVGI